MENTVFKYIEFLLPKHNCVVIPDFGAFIVNIGSVLNENNESFKAPVYTIIFNKDLTHDDGLLTSSIHKDQNISYDAASKKIKEVVKYIKSTLQQERVCCCANLGTLILDESNNIAFKSNPKIVYPSLFGLTDMYLPLLSQVELLQTNKKSNPVLKYIYGGAAAAAAAVLLFMGSSISIGDQLTTNAQQASFINTLTNTLIPTEVSYPSLADSATYTIHSVEEAIVEPQVSLRTYYIVIGGEDGQSSANHLLERFRSKEFPNAAIVQSQDRYRIYIASFSNKEEAERFLEIFRIENPKYDSAWLYSKRN